MKNINEIKSNGHEYVDLGLPSGTLWATMNIGASKPEDYGDYFMWGETEVRKIKDINWHNYKFYYEVYPLKGEYITKYNGLDEKETLDLCDDAARQNWGGYWRMPTYRQFIELYDNTIKSHCTVNDVNCLKFEGKNSEHILIPFAGFARLGITVNVNDRLYLWSSSRCFGEKSLVYELYAQDDKKHIFLTHNLRHNALPVRPVLFKENHLSLK